MKHILCQATLVGCCLTLSFIDAAVTKAQELAQPASRLVDSMGVNTHLGYIDTGYGDANFIVAELQELGVMHIRDGTALVASSTVLPSAYSALLQLGSSGVRFASGWGTPDPRNPNVYTYTSDTFNAAISNLTVNDVGYLEAFEGVNEIDVSGDQTWAEDWLQNQQNLIAADTMNMPLYSGSLAYAFNYPGRIPALPSNSDVEVYGNLHPYAGNANPGVIWPTQIAQVRASFRAPLKLVATESGYYDAVASGMGYVDDATEAKYIPRTFLENFRAGIYRTYIYELMDEISTWNAPLQETAGPHTCVQCSYGMITADGVEKPSFTAVKNLISILNSGATSSAPGALTYSISGGNANLHHLLLQKAPGIFDLILWQEISSFDTQTSVDISNPALPITLAVNASSVVTYDPTHGTSGTSQPISGYNVNLQVPDEALIVEITAP